MLKVAELVAERAERSWNRSIDKFIEVTKAEGVATVAFGKFLVWCSVFI